MSEQPSVDELLDRDGEWAIKVTIYRNGKRVGFCDTDGWETFDQAAYWVGEGLNTREVQPAYRHEPRTPFTSGGAR